jgi:hypothetical protein
MARHPQRPHNWRKTMKTMYFAAPMATRAIPVIRRHDAFIALAIIAMFLTSCSATNGNAFLGRAYDGPTAAYGYNLP